jgi:anion-transporting  ArsA/GET3 family ATPase
MAVVVYVTGKGGSGKTTVAAALALAAEAEGRRAIVCEVGGSHQLASSLSIDPRDALTEWMRAQPGGAVAAAVLSRSPAFAHFIDAAPGTKELLTIGKVVDIARAGDHDVVVVDGPSTGHALGMLSAPSTVAGVASHGPVAGQARELHEFLCDPERTTYVGVSLPEEMSVHELVELDDGLRQTLDRGLDLVVVNGMYPDRFTDAEAEALRELATQRASGRLDAALDEHRKARLHAARADWLRDRIAAPVVALPFLFGAEIGPPEYQRLARCLCAADDGLETVLAPDLLTSHPG